MPDHVLAIDQGTTSSRAVVYGAQLQPLASAQHEFAQHFPASGWVEHEVEDLWRSAEQSWREALAQARLAPSQVAAIGITNQRETTVLWERASGRPLHRAIVWQDRRTAARCQQLRESGAQALVSERSGLLLDPYFSATKLAWLLDEIDGARAAAERGELAFGTVDSYLIWRLSGARAHVTDATNAARTMLFNIHRGEWDEELLRLFRVPPALLPRVCDSAADFAHTDAAVFGAAVPITGVAGDQQAAAVGQACFSPGMLKSTYGTGCFALLNTGHTAVRSENRLLTTVAYQLSGRRSYALEGSIFVAGSAVQWLRDGLGTLESAAQSGALAAAADPAQQVYLVPAFTGLGAPWWDPEARGALYGLTRNTGPAELARAALESVGYQTRDLIEAMRGDWASEADTVLRVDGGMAVSDWAMQFLADILDAPVDRPLQTETTVLGAAWLAGQHIGLYPGMEAFAGGWARERRFEPSMAAEQRAQRYAGWRAAVQRTLSAPGEGR